MKIKVSLLFGWIYTFLFATFILGQCFQKSINFVFLSIISIIGLCFYIPVFKSDDKKNMIFILFFLFYTLILTMISKGGIGSVYTLSSGFIVFYCIKNFALTKLQKYVILFSLLFTNIYWIINSNGYYDAFFYNQWLGDGTMTNSNGVGKYICYTCILIYIFIKDLELNKITKLYIPFLFIMSFYGIYNCRARISLLVLTMFIILNYFLVEKKYFNKKNFNNLYNLIFILVTIFPYIYIFMYNHGIGSNIQTFGLSTKSLYSGREDIWIKSFEGIKNISCLLFGQGSSVDYWEGHVLNLHNNSMNLFIVFGLIALLIYYFLLKKIINNSFVFGNQVNNISIRLLIFFLCILMEGISDITIFYNPFILYYFFPLGLSCSESKKLRRNRWDNNIDANI